MTENMRSNEKEAVVEPKSANDIFAKGEALAKRMEEANKKAESILDRQEALALKQSFDGSSTAGVTQPPVDDSPQDYAKKALQGIVAKEGGSDGSEE